ncbi:DNA-directed RNA polymerase subunit alpha [candidate division LCP-89 bacterium B3_LCP]|uniref:DNA-directed RNA polymerase subunit alpha n=1 Tax=candidate division LCP-89 bacterium B3_LCP TaxID=2012998 RepID=A0A532UZT2_UNCL8|nr:MAG: DNA-directed RNA polymerase subunit alpha [candidate division LCP-89 bacterium B3_LCP]
MNGSSFQMPEAVELDEATYSATFGRFIVQPLERGYGVTVGNAMRRVLLESLTGAAIVSLKINGVLHEFTTIPGVVEDVSDIVLNLKAIRIKIMNRKPDKVILDLKGPTVFTAADVQKGNTDFEILNPDQHIATLEDDADFNMELIIRRGRGYIPADENRVPDQPIGTIPVDAIYSPIRNVTYSVENTRIGQRTDYEKLIFDITTDGSITPDDALSIAGRILKEHIQLFINFDIKAKDDEADQEIDEEALRIRKLLKKSVDELELSVRSANCLKEAKIRTISDLVEKDEAEMLKFKNFGRKSLTELTEILKEHGLEFGMDIERYLGPESKRR